MLIDFIISNPDHPVVSYIKKWMSANAHIHTSEILPKPRTGRHAKDILFLISCNEIISQSVRDAYKHCIVLHASDLPKGRGWSPYVWELLAGSETLTLSAISAEEGVDTGNIWDKTSIPVSKGDTFEEISDKLFTAEIQAVDSVIEKISRSEKPLPQDSTQSPTYFPKRSPADSEIDPSQPLVSLFNQIRVCDPDRYPAYFHLHGHTYEINIKKKKDI
jgi:methionyl-tRNA formyltransferase